MSDHSNGSDPMLGLEQQKNVDRNRTCLKHSFRKLSKYGMHMIHIVLSVIILIVLLKHNRATELESAQDKATYCVNNDGLFDCQFRSDKQSPMAQRQMARAKNETTLANFCLDGEQTSKRMDGFYWTDSSPNCRVFSQGMAIQGQNVIFEHPGTYVIANTIQLDSRNVGLDTTQVKHWMNINKQLIQMHLLTVNGDNTPVSHLYVIVKGVNKGDVITIHLSNINYLYTQPSFNTLTIQEIQ